jgi:hypothetical protein
MVRTDSTGDTLWTKTYGGEWQEEIYDIEETSDGGFAAVGYTHSLGAGNDPNIYFVKTDGNGLINDVENRINWNEMQYSLNQNYPNPFNPSTRIKYQLPSITQVTLKVYDVLGNEVATLVNEEKLAGIYEVEFSASNRFASGVYFYQLKAGEFIQTKKMILIK